MRELQPCLDTAMAGLHAMEFTIADVLGAYMTTCRQPLCGASLDQAAGKQSGTVTVLSIGSVDAPSRDVVRIFEAVAPEHRRIFLLAVLSLCYFSTRARMRLHSIAQAFDRTLAASEGQAR